MSKIIITEQDLTTATPITSDSIAVYIPGLVGTGGTLSNVALFESIEDFKTKVGTEPAEVTVSGSTTQKDLSYVMALELLGLGMPVVYQKINAKTSYFVTLSDSEVSGAVVTLSDSTAKTILNDANAEIFLEGTKMIKTEAATVGDGEVKIGTSGTSKTLTFKDGTALSGKKLVCTAPKSSNIAVNDVISGIYSLDTSEVIDRGEFNIRFVTSGGYNAVSNNGSLDLTSKLLSICTGRANDCVALLDCEKSVEIHKISDVPDLNLGPLGSNATMVVPWCNINLSFAEVEDDNNNKISAMDFPGSFAYLKAFAVSAQTYSNWYAVAGKERGQILGINKTKYKITNTEADAMNTNNGISINAITYTKPYGYLIWGNRTLKTNAGLKADSYLNIRHLIYDLKKQLYVSGRALMFEPNSDKLWVNFKAQVTPLLEEMKTDQGIRTYRMKKVASTGSTLSASFNITPIYAVEEFNLGINITDSDVETTEGGE